MGVAVADNLDQTTWLLCSCSLTKKYIDAHSYRFKQKTQLSEYIFLEFFFLLSLQ